MCQATAPAAADPSVKRFSSASPTRFSPTAPNPEEATSGITDAGKPFVTGRIDTSDGGRPARRAAAATASRTPSARAWNSDSFTARSLPALPCTGNAPRAAPNDDGAAGAIAGGPVAPRAALRAYLVSKSICCAAHTPIGLSRFCAGLNSIRAATSAAAASNCG